MEAVNGSKVFLAYVDDVDTIILMEGEYEKLKDKIDRFRKCMEGERFVLLDENRKIIDTGGDSRGP